MPCGTWQHLGVSAEKKENLNEQRQPKGKAIGGKHEL